ncbi:FecR domain-containing protein [Candidatus Uabimicrobium sp. HlEnr_7]|uniref:FecR domain-containing protein n=1 Tax=Candidatus Uabimicrobium helgolandensis TaxID=3095367 RepID=UPI0035561AD8
MSKIKPLFILACLAVAAYGAMNYLKSSGEIKVIYLMGGAFIENEEQTPLKVGDKVPEGMSVSLKERSKCFLQMPNGGVIKLNSQANVVFTENKKVELTTGSLEVKNNENIIVNTPQGNVNLLNAHANIRLVEEKTIVSVFSGEVEVEHQGDLAVVDEGQGVVVDSSGIGAPSDLPVTPVVKMPNSASNVTQVPISVKSERVSGAGAYYWECAVDDEFNLFLFEDQLQKANGSLQNHPDKDGIFYLRVCVENEKGFFSPFSEPVDFTLEIYKKINKHRSFAKNFYLNKNYQKSLEEAQTGLAISAKDVELLQYLSLSSIQTKEFDQAYKSALLLKNHLDPKTKSILKKISKEWKEKSPKDKRWKKLIK